MGTSDRQPISQSTGDRPAGRGIGVRSGRGRPVGLRPYLVGLRLSAGRQGQNGGNVGDTQPVSQRTAWWGNVQTYGGPRVRSEALHVNKGDLQRKDRLGLLQDAVQRRGRPDLRPPASQRWENKRLRFDAPRLCSWLAAATGNCYGC